MKNRYLFQKAEEELEKGLIETFELLDNNGNGTSHCLSEGFLEPSQLKAAMKVLGFDPSPEQLGKIIGTVDRTGKGVIRRDDFLRVMGARFFESDPKEQLRDGFDSIMNPDQLCVTVGSLAKATNDMGQSLSETTLQLILAECDKDGDGMLSYQEFLRVVRKTTPTAE